jgi:C-terminal processing protease CtpA/Prc
MTIEAKDNRFRVTFDNFTVYYDEREMKSGNAEYRFELDKIGKKLEKDMESLREYVTRGAAEKEKQKNDEEW